jgi:hypothetical protein
MVVLLMAAAAVGAIGVGSGAIGPGSATSAGAATSGGLTWKSTGPIDDTPPLGAGTHMQSVSCPSATLCVAVDADGNVLTSTNPTGGAATWQRWLVDPGNWLASVSCPTTALCVAGDSEGNLVISTNPTGGTGTWSKVDATPGVIIDRCPARPHRSARRPTRTAR